MISLLFLSGCAGGARETAKKIGGLYGSAGTVTARVAVKVELGDKTQITC
jgi:outer membrane lipoprotein-sorting protein